ncbi:hypothetical protein OVA24_08370 [Luteolibacter sp. SL250]|uniref:hypothetical protein n=1 Tax=Luteolibacter sp. SL250 TaxID=2995170 RepID=UPI002270AB20|nr:hypothetical protein [Luteolibacter sp. SL250]WAC21400.1 hypothetical protein OVA24_08370 [Luteolibacter sp. SL250]
MLPLRKILIVMVALLVAGAVRAPLELAMTKELRDSRLLPEPLDLDAREKIGQTGFAVALGGLRTLVATFYNLRAYTAFTEDRWMDAEESFETTVALAPSTTYYWVNGAWHLAYNAGHSYQNDSSLPPLRRQELWRSTVIKGRKFLERGIRNNPDSWTLNAELGLLLSDANKMPAFTGPGGSTPPELYQAAADAYHAASEHGGPAHTRRNRFYNLARVPGREAEALALGEKLAESRTNRTPTVLSLLFVLRMHANPAQDGYSLSRTLFNDDRHAYRALSFLWEDRRQNFPVDGLALVLKALEEHLAIPPEKSILR